MSIPISQFITPPPPPPCHVPPLVSICLFSVSVSLFLPCTPVHLYHFSRFHIYALIYDICFSLSDLLHSIWQSLDPSTSLQTTQFRSFLWLCNIPLYICTTSFLSIHLLYPLVHLYYFSRLHIYALIYSICFSFSDLLHSVWQSLGPSTSLQMTQFHSFLWLSNIPFHCRYVPHLLYLFVCRWAFRLLPWPGYCK